MAERWATFDRYGTLIDWNAWIGAQRPLQDPTRERADLTHLADTLGELVGG